MKKILSFALVIALCLTLAVSCKKDDGGSSMSGIYTHNDATYVFFGDNAVVYSADRVEYGLAGDVIANKDDLAAASTLAASDASKNYLVIEMKEGTKTLTSLTEEGKSQSAIVIPADVKDIAAGAFEGSSVKAVIIPEGSKLNLSNGCFKNGGSLAVIIDGSIAPSDLTCGKSMLDGTSGVTFYIAKAALSTYEGHYNWANFKDYLKGI